MTTTIHVKIDDNCLADVLISAYEGGWRPWPDRQRPLSNYWARQMDGKPSPFRSDEDGFRPDFDVEITDIEAGGKKHRLTLPILRRGLQIMADKYPAYFADIVAENDDATTGDVLLQCALFGELIYG